ncbi:MAG: 2-amino-4-hydroxy-6-hydroxymethyldihydropteridine pyrophosphokinae FolK [Pseudomonadota bacterium]
MEQEALKLKYKFYTAYVGLGSNIGDGIQNLNDAMIFIAQNPNIFIVQKSNFYQSKPFQTDGDDYTNSAIKIKTTYKPLELLSFLQYIELQFGRERPYKYAPRTLDLDLLIYEDEEYHIHNCDKLNLPHPQITLRAFVLMPLLDLDENISIPHKGKAQEYIDSVASQEIKKIRAYTHEHSCCAKSSCPLQN